MDTNNHFNISRFGLLLKVELFRSKKGLAMALGITFGILFVCTLLEIIFGGHSVYDAHNSSYVFNLLIGGFILSSIAFKDLRDSSRRHSYLTLPASTLEKVASMWLLTCVGWIVAFTLTFLLYALIINTIGQIITSHITYITFNPFADIPLLAIGYYFVLQAVFLVGAVHFKEFVLAKTIFTLLVFGAVCCGIAYFIMADMLPFEECSGTPPDMKNMSVYKVCLLVKWMFWALLAPLCWVTTYFGLKEKEV